MVIDANLYWFSEDLFRDETLARQFLDDASRNSRMTGRLVTGADGRREIIMENPLGFANLNYRAGDYTVDGQLAAMDAAGVDTAVLKVPGAQEWMSLDLCRLFNDGMADAARDSGGRLVPLACLPPSSDQDSIDELRRCRDVLGFPGVQLSAHYGHDYLDDERFTGFFDELNAVATTVYVHHTPTPVDDASLFEYTNLRRSYGRCVDQTTVIGRLLFSGFFERHPNLTFVHSMLGGAFFAVADLLMPRLAPTDHRFDERAAERRQTFVQHVHFELSHAQPWGAAQIECAVRVLGADHLVYGSSYPVNPAWMAGGVDFIRGLELSDTEQNLILHRNAARLYGVEAPAVAGTPRS